MRNSQLGLPARAALIVCMVVIYLHSSLKSSIFALTNSSKYGFGEQYPHLSR